MKNCKVKLIIGVFLVCMVGSVYMMPNVYANDVDSYSFTYNDITYYSDESLDDAWWQAMEYNHTQEILSKEQIIEMYEEFAKRDLNEEIVVSDNSQSSDEDLPFIYGELSWVTSFGNVLPLKYIYVEIFEKKW